MTESTKAGSDLAGDIMLGEPCGSCRKKATNKINLAAWFCKECDDYICDECKSLHKLFKATEGHVLSNLHPHCRPCEKKGTKQDAVYFCEEYQVFVCDECRSYHKLLPITEDHDVVNRQEKVKADKKVVAERDASVMKTSTSENIKNSSTEILESSVDGGVYAEHQDHVQEKNQQITHNDNTQTNLSYTTQQSSVSSQSEAYVPFSRRTAMFVTKFDVNIPGDRQSPRIRSCSFLPDSRLLVVDERNQKLKLFDVNYKFVTATHFNDFQWAVSVYDSSEVAVTVGYSDIVRLSVDCDVIKEKGKISPGFRCLGVSYASKDKLVVTGVAEDDDIMCVYNIAGERLSRLSLGQGGKIPSCVTTDGDNSRAYVLTSDTAVSAIDLTTNQIVFTYKHRYLSGPRGIAVDKENYLYICDWITDTIHQVSPAGTHIQTLRTLKDSCTTTISFTPSGDTFIVGGFSETVQVYKMCSMHKRIENASCTYM